MTTVWPLQASRPARAFHAYKIYNDSGNGTWAAVLAALGDVLQRADIEFINMSIAGVEDYLPGECESPTFPAEGADAPAVWFTVQALREEGTLSFAGGRQQIVQGPPDLSGLH
ncbi:MAG: hypothetical protein WEE64_15510 [Dehalococcoidia bacterium]